MSVNTVRLHFISAVILSCPLRAKRLWHRGHTLQGGRTRKDGYVPLVPGASGALRRAVNRISAAIPLSTLVSVVSFPCVAWLALD